MIPMLATGFVVLLLAPALAGERTVQLAVDNMTCAACPFIVERTLTAVPGVIAADVSFQERAARVIFDDSKTSVGVLTAATAANGYPSRLVK